VTPHPKKRGFIKKGIRMNIKRVMMLGPALALVGTGCRATEGEPSFETVSASMQQYVDHGEIAGAVTLVMHQGKQVHCSAVGMADIEKGRPMRMDSIFRIASMTKPITATAMLILQDEGKLNLDDEVGRYLPCFANPRLSDGTPVKLTIRDLMTHTGGISGKKDHIETMTLEEVAEMLSAEPIEYQPGTSWKYTQGITLCGRIIEVASGMPLDEFFEQRIFKPLDMKDTTFFPQGSQRERVVMIYRPGENGVGIRPTEYASLRGAPETKPILLYPSGGLFSTARDMALFFQAILNGGILDGSRIVSEESVRQMTSMLTPKEILTGFTPGNSWGLGWAVVREPQGVTAMLSPGTFGHGGAYGTQAWCDPARKIVYILLIQRLSFGNGDASPIRQDFQQRASDAIGSAPGH
jgi:CubicO group peptidase (beta-lactamase class C family)